MKSVGLETEPYDVLHRWSISDPATFWEQVWDFTAMVGERGPTALQRPSESAMFGARYYPEGSLNFAENLLAGPEHHLAVTVANETGITRRVSRGELRLMVARAQSGLKALGVGRGDCVAGILPNNLEALVALLATASLGALWSSCSPDFGVAGIVDRIGQIEPKVLFASPVYVYSGKQHDISDRLLSIVEAVSSLTTVVCSGAAG